MTEKDRKRLAAKVREVKEMLIISTVGCENETVCGDCMDCALSSALDLWMEAEAKRGK